MALRAALVACFLALAGCAQEAPPPSTPPATAVPLSQSVPPGKWRAVLVAGDNNSPAFDNGIASMRDKLAARGVRDIRLYTANARSAGSGQAASAANVQRALAAGSGEACLAFVTSHGERQGVFLRTDNRFFTPAALDRALAEGCGSLPTVVIVSACHSGTFINAQTRRPNRVILTAAATDRVSFGCGAGDQYTYYDRCLLMQFDRATTWRDLAAATRACVEATERELGVRRSSLPQTFVGNAVADLRVPGR